MILKYIYIWFWAFDFLGAFTCRNDRQFKGAAKNDKILKTKHFSVEDFVQFHHHAQKHSSFKG